MKTLRFSLLSFAVGLAIFFNIERLDFGQENIIDIDTFVYVLSLIAIVLTLTIPALQPKNVLVGLILWSGVYFVGKTVLYLYTAEGRLLIGGIYTYLTITELTLFVILMWLTYRVVFALKEFEGAVEKITFSGDVNRRVRLLEEAGEDIQVEMFRSRYNHHPLGVIVVEPQPESIETRFHRLVQDVQKTMVGAYIINNMANTLSKYLRRTDLILENRKQGRFIVVCPDTNAEDMNLLVEYIQTVAEDQLGTAVAYGIATFPDEAVTFEELVLHAEHRLITQKNGSPPTHPPRTSIPEADFPTETVRRF